MGYCAHDILVQNAHTAGSYRAGSQFFKAGNAQFAHDKNIERRAEPLRDFERHRHTAPWQPKHNYVIATRILDEFVRKQPAGFGSVGKSVLHFPS
jgi:hypothetical protein